MKTLSSWIGILALAAAMSAEAVTTHGSHWGRTHPSAEPVSNQGSWSVQFRDGQGLWASTDGDRGSLGQYCTDAGACAWLLVLWDAVCSEGEQHPVLVNTDRAASSHVVQCIGAVHGIGSALAFLDFDRVDFSMRGAAVAGIAIPEHMDAIGVAHFKLDGAAAVIDSMRARIVAQAKVE